MRGWLRSAPAVSDALFRRGLTFALATETRRARRDFRRARRRVDDADSRRRIDVQLGVLDAAVGRRLRSVKRLGPAVLELRELVHEHPAERWYLAQALIGLGDLHRGEATLELPRRSLARVTWAVERQASELEIAQGFYIEAAQQMQPTWTAEATSRLAVGYLELSVRLLELREAPGRLSEFERQGLRSWIDTQRPGLDRKSRDAFRLCADVFTETGLNNVTTQVCREMLKSTMEDETSAPLTPDRTESPSPEPR